MLRASIQDLNRKYESRQQELDNKFQQMWTRLTTQVMKLKQELGEQGQKVEQLQQANQTESENFEVYM